MFSIHPSTCKKNKLPISLDILLLSLLIPIQCLLLLFPETDSYLSPLQSNGCQILAGFRHHGTALEEWKQNKDESAILMALPPSQVKMLPTSCWQKNIME